MVDRVDVRGIAPVAADGYARNHTALTELQARLLAAAPLLREGAIALVDSPRWPSDKDCSQTGVVARSDHAGGRGIDAVLRALVKKLRSLGAGAALRPLSMFPTPRFDYFGVRVTADLCKPHLQALGRELFGRAVCAEFGPPRGGTFTRFMITGFATYKALAMIGAETYECYPDLQFRLWCNEPALPPKKAKKGNQESRAVALAARLRIIGQLAAMLKVSGCGMVCTIDAADATILALSAAAATRYGVNVIVKESAEGEFLVSFGAADVGRLRLAVLD